MDSFDRLRLLRHGLYREKYSFKRWFVQLKRCYPVPEWQLAELLCLDLGLMWKYRNARRQASHRTFGLIGLLIGFRVGAFKTTRDLLQVRKWMATGRLEAMVDAFLAKEAANIAAGKARAEARKRARVSQQVSQSASSEPKAQ